MRKRYSFHDSLVFLPPPSLPPENVIFTSMASAAYFFAITRRRAEALAGEVHLPMPQSSLRTMESVTYVLPPDSMDSANDAPVRTVPAPIRETLPRPSTFSDEVILQAAGSSGCVISEHAVLPAGTAFIGTGAAGGAPSANAGTLAPRSATTSRPLVMAAIFPETRAGRKRHSRGRGSCARVTRRRMDRPIAQDLRLRAGLARRQGGTATAICHAEPTRTPARRLDASGWLLAASQTF